MGIEGLGAFVQVNHPTVVSHKPSELFEVDHLFIDVNNLLYKKWGGKISVKDEEPALALFKVITSQILDTTDNMKVNNSIFFSIDGPSPLSKINAQKERRLKNEEYDKIIYHLNEKKLKMFGNLNDTENDLELIEEKWLNKKIADSSGNLVGSCFTPGTEFMGQLKSYLIFLVRSGFYKKGFISSLKNVYISASDRIGEGEWKMFEMINSRNSNISKNEKILIVSNDSDLILFSLLTKFENLFILNRESNKMIDIGKLRKEIQKGSGIEFDENDEIIGSNEKNKNEISRQVIVDFANLWFLGGTDHLPKISGYSFNDAWAIYNQLVTHKLNTDTKLYEYSTPLYNEKSSQYNYNLLREIIIKTEEYHNYNGINNNKNNNNNNTDSNISNHGSKSLFEVIVDGELKTTKSISSNILTPLSNSLIKNKLQQTLLYYSLSNPNIKNYKVHTIPREKPVHQIIIDDKIIESNEDFKKLADSFLSKNHPFWVKNINSIKEKYFYKLRNIFASGTKPILDITSDELIFQVISKRLKKGIAPLTTKTKSESLDINGEEEEEGDSIPTKTNEIIQLYMYGLQWNFNYFNGVCKDFKFIFPFNQMTTGLFKAIENPLLIDQKYSDIKPSKQPYSPLLYCLLLIDYPNKHLIPPIYHSIYNKFKDFFGLDLKRSKLESLNKSTFVKILREFNRLTKEDLEKQQLSNSDSSNSVSDSKPRLTKYQKSQLEFHPTLKLSFVHKSRLIRVFNESITQNSTSNFSINKKFTFIKQLDYNNFFSNPNEMFPDLIKPDKLDTINEPTSNYHFTKKYIKKPKEEFARHKKENIIKFIKKENTKFENNKAILTEKRLFSTSSSSQPSFSLLPTILLSSKPSAFIYTASVVPKPNNSLILHKSLNLLKKLIK